MPLEAVFDGRMSWAETWLLTCQLASDPSSCVGAAMAGWAYPMSREAMVLADLFDLTVAAAPKKSGASVQPYPRPSDTARRPRKQVLSQDEIRAALAARGHQLEEASDVGD